MLHLVGGQEVGGVADHRPQDAVEVGRIRLPAPGEPVPLGDQVEPGEGSRQVTVEIDDQALGGGNTFGEARKQRVDPSSKLACSMQSLAGFPLSVSRRSLQVMCFPHLDDPGLEAPVQEIPVGAQMFLAVRVSVQGVAEVETGLAAGEIELVGSGFRHHEGSITHELFLTG